MMSILTDEARLKEIVQMVGMDALSDPDRLKLEAARSIREDFLHQDAFDPVDTYTSPEKCYELMDLVMDYYDKSVDALNRGADIKDIISLPVREDIGRFKYVEEDKTSEAYEKIQHELDTQLADTLNKGEDY